MQTREENIALFHEAGLRFLEHFTLTDAAGWAYYEPLARRIELLCRRYHDDPEALAILEQEKLEIEMYRNKADYYGFVFYLGQKPTA